MAERTEQNESCTSELPAVAEGRPAQVVLTNRLRDIALAADVPAEILAAYICEEWGAAHEPGQPVILFVDGRATTSDAAA